MLTSYNGWTASANPADFGGLDNSVIPGTDGVKYAPGVRSGHVATIAFWWGWQWHTRVERLVAPGCWGYAFKHSANSAALISCHAGATAWDTNAPAHPNGVHGTLAGPALEAGKTKAQVVDEMMAYLEGVVYSGKGAWGNGTVDEMHAEIAEAATVSQVYAVADKIIRDFGPRESWATKPPVLPSAPPQPWLSLPSVRSRPLSFQRWYNAYPFRPALLPIIKPVANSFGPQSLAALKKVQSRYGLVPDGIDGPLTKRVLWDLGWRG